MRLKVLSAAAAGWGTAAAFPANTDWDAVLPDAPNGCTSCHFDRKPIMDSSVVKIEGLPDKVVCGGRYEVTIAVPKGSALTSAFLARFDGGEIVKANDMLETNGSAVRLSEPAPLPGQWDFTWQAPDQPGEATMLVAANLANDDASPFGDQTHYLMRKVRVE